MARRIVLVVRVAVCQVDVVRCGIEVVGHLRLGRTVVQLIGQSQRLGVVLIEEALVVDASVERSTAVLHVCGTAVAEVTALSAYRSRGSAVTLHRHAVHLSRQIQHAHGIYLITQCQTTHHKRGLHVVG